MAADDALSSGDGLDEFADVADLLRLGPLDSVDEPAPDGLWDRIVAELDDAPDGDVSGVLGADVVDFAAAKRSRRPQILAAVVGIAAALALVVLPLVLAVRSSPSGEERFAAFDALDDFDGNGWAELDGHDLTVGVDGLDADDGWFYELWLLDLQDGELRDLVSLGTIGADGTFDVADDVDLDRFTVVDISLERDDGNPEHSGASVLRGELS